LELFDTCIKSNISAIMVGHQVVYGEINSSEKPASISKEVIEIIPENVLVVSDEVNMLGLRSRFLSKREMYKELINSGENLILDFQLDKRALYNLLEGLEKDVKEGKISEDKVNESVKKILKLKGYEVI
jgi:beta-N-acetylhexosaminidase